jgi:exonuclease III
MTCHYKSHLNIGTELRGTAILVKRGITVTEIKRLPSGRGMAIKFQNTRIINIYAPSGAERKNKREKFYTTDIIPLLPPAGVDKIMGGDFNCVLQQADATGQPTFSRALDALVRGLQFVDAWDQQARPLFTHYKTMGATRSDRFYVTRNLSARKTGV